MTVLTPETIAAVGRLDLETAPVLAVVTAGLSNLVSNVPAVLVLKPFIANSLDPQRAWLVVAMASTLAGNFTLVGSVANLIVAQRAHARGVTIGFWAYFKVGAPLTLLTILFGVWWLQAIRRLPCSPVPSRAAGNFGSDCHPKLSTNGMVRPCSRPASDKLARGADKEHAHGCDSTECDCRNRH